MKTTRSVWLNTVIATWCIVVYVCSTECTKSVLQFRTDVGSQTDGQTLCARL